MNRNNPQSLRHRAATTARNVGKNVATGTALAMLAVGSAAAQTAGFDSSTIITKITENAATAALIVGAFILAVWGLKSMGLLKGRGA